MNAPLAMVALCMMAAMPCSAGTVLAEDVQVSTYLVSGHTLAEVADTMQAKGPHGYWGYTKWHVDWTGACAVTVSATITLPQLAPGTGLGLGDKSTFDRMLRALTKHETGHVDFARGWAADLAKGNCDQASQDRLQFWLDTEKTYDATTHHGADQGAVLK